MGRKVEQEVEREDQREETAHTWMAMEMTSKTQTWATVRVCAGLNDKTTYLRECARRSVDVVAGVHIVRSHASMDVVIDVRVVECRASIHVVIGIRVVLCHPLVYHFVFSSLCPNSHLVVML